MANFIDFKKVIIHNFGSYGHTEVDLKQKGFCAVSGQNNFKKDNALSNGSGKSFIWSAICYTITGETLNGLQKNLKNINIEDDNTCYTKLIFNVNTDEYEITRFIAPKSDLQIIKNGTDVSNKTYRESEKKLGELLPDLTKDLIASTIIIGQGMPNKFSSFSPSGRKELLEKLTKSDFMIEDIKNRVESRQNEILNKIRDYDLSLVANRTKLSTDETALTKAEDEVKNTVKPNFEQDIETSSKQIKAIENDINKLIEAKKIKDDELEAATKELYGLSQDKSKMVTEELQKYHEAIDPVKRDKLTAETTISNLKSEVARLKAVKDVCPTCGQKLPGAVKPDTTEQEKQIKALTESLTPLVTRINDVEAKHLEYSKVINEDFITREQAISSKISGIKAELNKIINEMNDNTQSLNIERDHYNKLVYDKANWDIHQKALNKTITDLQKSITALKNVITITDNAKTDLQAHLAVVKKMDSLAKRDFRGYLLANIIAYIDKKAKDYSEIVFETRDLNVYIDGNALDISYCGKMFDNLSGGEKQRVDLILQFAIRDMLNVYLNSSANILVLDEVLDFLDKKSCKAMFSLFNTVLSDIESVFIISHHSDTLDLQIDSEIQVIKDANGISTVNCY